MVYFEPIYLQAAQANTIPELKQVIVAYGSRVVMRATVQQALSRHLRRGHRPTTGPLRCRAKTTTTNVTTETTPPSDLTALIAQANQLYLDALAGAEDRRLGRIRPADRSSWATCLQQIGGDAMRRRRSQVPPFRQRRRPALRRVRPWRLGAPVGERPSGPGADVYYDPRRRRR